MRERREARKIVIEERDEREEARRESNRGMNIFV